MKLATRKNNSRDGELMLVKRDLSRVVSAQDIAPTLQYALDNWLKCEPLLQERYAALNRGALEAEPFMQQQCESPLPRAYQWVDGSAYVNHVELVRKARGADMPENFWHDPLMYQGGSDSFLGPHDPIVLADEQWGIDFEAEIAVITVDTPMGVTADKAGDYICLLALVNDVSLRHLIPNELAKGFGFLQSKPSSAFSPVAVTLDEVSPYWRDCKIHLPLVSSINEKVFGKPNAGEDMTFNFAKLIAHAAKTRSLAAGTIVGSGTVANQDRSQGSSCLAERRMLEAIEHGEARTPFLSFGDQVSIAMYDEKGDSIFGEIKQAVQHYTAVSYEKSPC